MPMKRLLLIVMLFFAATLSAQQVPPNWLGWWWLGFIEEASLPVNLKFGVADGELKPFLYSPLQSKEPMVATKWSLVDDTLHITHKPSGVRLVLVWNDADSSFEGSFRQGMLRTQLHMKRTDTLFSIVRPQTPQPPFPYRETEVVIERKKAGVKLAGTLTVPNGKGPFPAVVLVSGSGQQNRDEELLGHKPFLVLADWLARQGIAVLRYDDRGVGGSKGEIAKATTFDFADDAESALEWLRRQKMIDRHHVGILGHSEGAMIASIVASRNRKVDFVVFLAGPGVKGSEILVQQNARIMELGGIEPYLNERHDGMLREFYGLTDTLNPASYEACLLELCEKWSEGLNNEERKRASLRKADAMMLAQQLQIPWLQQFIRFDPSIFLRKMRCRLLAINGDLDCQVIASNLDAVKQATGGRADTRMVAGLNHLMQHCASGAPNEYMFIEETMAPEVMSMVSEWILLQSAR